MYHRSVAHHNTSYLSTYLNRLKRSWLQQTLDALAIHRKSVQVDELPRFLDVPLNHDVVASNIVASSLVVYGANIVNVLLVYIASWARTLGQKSNAGKEYSVSSLALHDALDMIQ